METLKTLQARAHTIWPSPEVGICLNMIVTNVPFHKPGTNDMEKLCAKCGVAFLCNTKEKNCWCKTVDLSVYTLKYLETNFSDCLCPTCLQPFWVVDMDAVFEDEEEGY